MLIDEICLYPSTTFGFPYFLIPLSNILLSDKNNLHIDKFPYNVVVLVKISR